MKNRRPVWIGALLLLACGEPTMTPVDGSGLVDGGGVDGDAGPMFDPSMVYPGEGDACEFSMFCEYLQICVDGECQRHERFAPEDLEVGELVRIPHEVLMTSRLYTEAPFDWSLETGYPSLFGTTMPGDSGPALLMWFYDNAKCQVAIYGVGPVRVVGIEGLACAAAGISPDGQVVVGGPDTRPGAVAGARRFVVFGAEGDVLVDRTYPVQMYETLAAEFSDPGTQLWNPTSFSWENERFVFSAGVSARGSSSRMPGGGFPGSGARSHTFYAELTIEGDMALRRVGGEVVQPGSYGWLVRDSNGIRSIMTSYSYDESLRLLNTRVELLSLSDGSRSLLTSGEGSLGAVGRYFQWRSDRWRLAVFSYPDNCSVSLFSEGELEREYVFLADPCGLPWLPDGWGTSAPFGPSYSGHHELDWISMRYTFAADGSLLDSVVYVDGRGEWASIGDSRDPGRVGQSVSRYQKTVELFGEARGTSGLLLAWEGQLSRRER